MWLKLILSVLFLISLISAFVVAPAGVRKPKGETDRSGSDDSDRRLRVLSWNIGNGDLEQETRAHDDDLEAVGEVILDKDADAVALQELTDADQLKLLLTYLHNRYRGYVSKRGSADRVEAVLVKKSEAKLNFIDVPAGDRFAVAATFRLDKDSPGIVLVSAHADAFNASRRRSYSAEVVDWTRSHNNDLAFIAGDFNFEVSTRTQNNLFTDDAKHDSESYAYLLKYYRDLGLDAGETSINDRRIDYVFGPTSVVSLGRAEVLRSAAVGRMDHWPLLVEVSF